MMWLCYTEIKRAARRLADQFDLPVGEQFLG